MDDDGSLESDEFWLTSIFWDRSTWFRVLAGHHRLTEHAVFLVIDYVLDPPEEEREEDWIQECRQCELQPLKTPAWIDEIEASVWNEWKKNQCNRSV